MNSSKKCGNCGADYGLHHFQTNQCPKNGVEEWRENRKQEWEESIFIALEEKLLQENAGTLLLLCQRSLQTFKALIAEGSLRITDTEDNVVNDLEKMINKFE